MDTRKTQSSSPSSINMMVATTDVLFECPSCEKSLVVNSSASGMTVECPQCHLSLIVPPQSESPMSPPPPMRSPSPSPVNISAPSPVQTDSASIAAWQEQLHTLVSQLQEQESHWNELMGRIVSQMNQINHDWSMLAQLETSQKQTLNEWNQIAEKIAEIKLTVPPLHPSPATGSHRDSPH